MVQSGVSAAVLLILSSLCTGAELPKRRALLVGNGNYTHLGQLAEVRAQVTDMQKALENAGFEVTAANDVSLAKLVAEIVPGFSKNGHAGDVCFFYFSGYAVQAQQDNYMLPVEFDPHNQDDLSIRAYSLTALQQKIQETKPGINIFTLEIALEDKQLQEQSAGLAQPDYGGVQNTIFAFSVSPNEKIPNLPADQRGLFTKYLAETIRRPGLNLEAVFGEVQRAVNRASAQRQQTFYLPYLNMDFFFHAPEIKVRVVQNHRDRTNYVLLPAGELLMGCVPNDTKCKPNEKPQHPATISKSFWMAATDVDVTAFQRYQAAEKAEHRVLKLPQAPLWDPHWKETNHPVVNVSWALAQSYCGWVGGRLPTEAEWEYAARGGLENQIYPLNDENSRDKANFDGKKGSDIFEYTSPVGAFDPNPFSLYDMAGNVWQWTSDWYSPDSYSRSATNNPVGPDSGKEHVVRGGSFNSDPREHLRISFRKSSAKGENNIGFRCVLDDNAKTSRILQLDARE